MRKTPKTAEKVPEDAIPRLYAWQSGRETDRTRLTWVLAGPEGRR